MEQGVRYMKFRILLTVVFLFCFILSPGFFPASGKAPDESPSAFLPENRYIFSSVVEGSQIEHDFIIKNKGTAPLNIEKVKTG